MKRFLFIPCLLCLLVGLLVGEFLPNARDSAPLSSPAANMSVTFSQGEQASPHAPLQAPAWDDNLTLLSAAYRVTHALSAQDYAALAEFVHPDRGVTFTPYSTVSDSDLTHKAEQIKALASDSSLYTWGLTDGRGSLINMTMTEYLAAYVFDLDYTRAPQIGLDQVILVGNALENVVEAYPNCRFVDFSFPTIEPEFQGLDWRSLKLVFQLEESGWYLVGVIHGQWTI